jgi:hypothetical protein
MEIVISEDGFLNALNNVKKGILVEELDNALIRAINAIRDHGGKATVGITLEFKRIKDMETAIKITPKLIEKLPQEDMPTQAMFATHAGGLVAQHQEQTTMELQPLVAFDNVSSLKRAE